MALSSQHAHDLAKKVTKDFLGEPAEAVLSALLRLGRCALPELTRAAGLPPRQLRAALLVLLQHNFARSWLQPEEAFVTGVRPAQYLYEPCPDWVLQVFRRPAFLLAVKEDVVHHAAGLAPDPDLAQAVMSVLLDHGRLTLDQLVKAVRELQQEAARPRRSGSVRSGASGRSGGGDGGQAGGGGEEEEHDDDDDDEEEEEEDAASSEQDVRHMFFLLVQQRLIEQAPPCGLPPPPDKPRAAGRRPRKEPKPGSKEWVEQQEEIKRQRPAQIYRGFRFRVPEDLFSDSGREEMWRGMAVTRWALEEGERLAAGGGGGSNGGGAGGAGKAGGGGRKRKKGEAAAEKEEEVDEEEFLEALHGGGRAAGAAPRGRAAAGARGRAAGGRGGVGKRRRVVESDDEEEGGGGGAGKAAEKPAAAAAAAVRIKEEPQAAADAPPPPILWRANGEELNRRLRNRVCLDLVEAALGAEPRAVLAAMLEYSRPNELALTDAHSIQMTEGDIAQQLRSAVEEGRLEAFPSADVGHLLATLEAHSLKAVERVVSNAMANAWRVNILDLLERARYYQTVAAIKDKFGSQGVRVFQLLSSKGWLEQKQVAELTMGPQKETRELLYRMMRAGFVDTQLVPRGADRAPSRSFYTWRVDLAGCFRRIAADTYKAAVNVWSRYAATMEKNADLVAASRAAYYGGGSINITDDARPRMARLHAVNQALVAAQLRLDEMAALFSDFSG